LTVFKALKGLSSYPGLKPLASANNLRKLDMLIGLQYFLFLKGYIDAPARQLKV